MTNLKTILFAALATLSATAAHAHPGHSDVPHVHVESAAQTWLQVITVPGLVVLAGIALAFFARKALAARKGKLRGGAS